MARTSGMLCPMAVQLACEEVSVCTHIQRHCKEVFVYTHIQRHSIYSTPLEGVGIDIV